MAAITPKPIAASERICMPGIEIWPLPSCTQIILNCYKRVDSSVFLNIIFRL